MTSWSRRPAEAVSTVRGDTSRTHSTRRRQQLQALKSGTPLDCRGSGNGELVGQDRLSHVDWTHPQTIDYAPRDSVVLPGDRTPLSGSVA
jgi:hypothetical protein